jgi:hypothetical protein
MERDELLSFRKAWAAVAELIRKGRDACINRRWAEAAGAFDAALKESAFDWRLVGPDLSTPEQWIGGAFFRAGDYDRHLRFFRELCAGEGKPVESLGGFLRAMLLPANPAPELLTLASNLLPPSGIVFTNGFDLAFSHMHRSLLEYRSGQYAEALISARRSAEQKQASETHALIIQSMASHRLGQTNEARLLWQQVIARPNRLGPPGNMNHMRLTAECYLEEAARLLGVENELRYKPAEEAQPTNAGAPRAKP